MTNLQLAIKERQIAKANMQSTRHQQGYLGSRYEQFEKMWNDARKKIEDIRDANRNNKLSKPNFN